MRSAALPSCPRHRGFPTPGHSGPRRCWDEQTARPVPEACERGARGALWGPERGVGAGDRQRRGGRRGEDKARRGVGGAGALEAAPGAAEPMGGRRAGAGGGGAAIRRWRRRPLGDHWQRRQLAPASSSHPCVPGDGSRPAAQAGSGWGPPQPDFLLQNPSGVASPPGASTSNEPCSRLQEAPRPPPLMKPKAAAAARCSAPSTVTPSSAWAAMPRCTGSSTANPTSSSCLRAKATTTRGLAASSTRNSGPARRWTPAPRRPEAPATFHPLRRQGEGWEGGRAGLAWGPGGKGMRLTQVEGPRGRALLHDSFLPCPAVGEGLGTRIGVCPPPCFLLLSAVLPTSPQDPLGGPHAQLPYLGAFSPARSQHAPLRVSSSLTATGGCVAPESSHLPLPLTWF
ncbi:LIM domain-containing protein 2 isoform X1 [Callithrix jacchus]|uniref:LIM domain-containing protein 2 isoform X1 n=1 Tax=Callithrix jacchus TaxID=9483 RepID=UPI00159DBDC5|nr:LIM domain-containing protein 2 isoform X1 [Callithrix jacchus]